MKYFSYSRNCADNSNIICNPDIIGLFDLSQFSENSSKRATEKCADKTIVFVIIIYFAFLLFGAHILNFFSISPDFKIAGGIIPLLSALNSSWHAGASAWEERSAKFCAVPLQRHY